MPLIEKEYRIKGEKRYRSIAGLSIGGGGTFMYALHHPELFSSACPLSADTGPLFQEELDSYLKRNGWKLSSEKKMEAWYNNHRALELIKEMPEGQKKSVRWFIDCSDDDFLFEGNSLVHIAMRRNKIPHEFRIRDGGHSWTYRRESLPEVLCPLFQRHFNNTE